MWVLSVHTEDGRRSPDKSSAATSWDFPGGTPCSLGAPENPQSHQNPPAIKSSNFRPSEPRPKPRGASGTPRNPSNPAKIPVFPPGAVSRSCFQGWKGPVRMLGHAVPQGRRRSRPVGSNSLCPQNAPASRSGSSQKPSPKHGAEAEGRAAREGEALRASSRRRAVRRGRG